MPLSPKHACPLGEENVTGPTCCHMGCSRDRQGSTYAHEARGSCMTTPAIAEGVKQDGAVSGGADNQVKLHAQGQADHCVAVAVQDVAGLLLEGQEGRPLAAGPDVARIAHVGVPDD